jgi:biliverdin reductase
LPKSLGIAVVGAGRAGQARLRALEGNPRAHRVAVVSRTRRDGTSLDQVLADPAVGALCVCTPNLLHAEVARFALEAKKHALVEFPLAPTVEEARGLFDLSRERGLVLHEEHIELLSPSQAWLRERVKQLGALRRATVEFRADASGWINETALAGSPALCSLARLHRVVDLFGEAEVQSASLEVGEGWRLDVELGFARGGSLRLSEARTLGGARGTTWSGELEGGPLESPPAEPAGGVFARDLDSFLDRVEKNAAPYVSDARCLHVMELVGAIERLLC